MRRLRGLGRALLRSYDKQRVSAVRVCGPKVGAEAACAEQKAVEALDVSFYALKEGGERGVSRRARANTVCDPADCGSQAMAAIVMWPGGGDGLSQREGDEGILQGIGGGRALCSLCLQETARSSLRRRLGRARMPPTQPGTQEMRNGGLEWRSTLLSWARLVHQGHPSTWATGTKASSPAGAWRRPNGRECPSAFLPVEVPASPPRWPCVA